MPSTWLFTALPLYKSGNLGLQEVKVASPGKSGFYIRKVCDAMQASLTRDFHYPLDAAARRILEDSSSQPGYQRELHNFRAPEIHVTAEALVLSLDFELTVK